MALTPEQKAALPKAQWLRLGWSPVSRFQKNRLSNAMRWSVWKFRIVYRMPYLEDVAKKLHPHLFKQPQ